MSSYTDPKWQKVNENLFEKFKEFYEYKDEELKLLSYRNLTS